MNEKLAKKVRKQVYGPKGNYRDREYRIKMPRGYRPGMSIKEIMGLVAQHGRRDAGQIIADKKRQLYQLTKKMLRRSEYGRA
jgi:hypothetical protein